jgi:hypothetical protein
VTVRSFEILKDERLLEWRLKQFAEAGSTGSRTYTRGVVSYVPQPLEDQLCEECQNSVVTVILSSGQALCTACAAIRFRIPTTDRAQLRAAIEAGTSAGAHWPRNSHDRPESP